MPVSYTGAKININMSKNEMVRPKYLSLVGKTFYILEMYPLLIWVYLKSITFRRNFFKFSNGIFHRNILKCGIIIFFIIT